MIEGFDPNHDSLFLRFEQLDNLVLDLLNLDDRPSRADVSAIIILIQLIRSQVLK